MQRLKLERNKLFSIATTPTPQRKKENVAISLIAERKKKKNVLALKQVLRSGGYFRVKTLEKYAPLWIQDNCVFINLSELMYNNTRKWLFFFDWLKDGAAFSVNRAAPALTN